MPYYPKINTLFIHVPKTGGTTMESCLKRLSPQGLFGSPNNMLLKDPPYNKISLQHQTYLTIYENRKLLRIPFDASMQIITIVRNPYNRLISDLIANRLMDPRDNQARVLEVIKQYVAAPPEKYDNHSTPQWHFLTDANDQLIPGLILFRTENLTQELKNYGFTHYERIDGAKDYTKYYCREAFDLVNEIYGKDFELFGYEKL
jgi:hypothetical protein